MERLLIRFIALILALVVCGAVIVALVGLNPVDVYKADLGRSRWDLRDVCGRLSRDTMVLVLYLHRPGTCI